jgi:hypothetical protein
VVVRTGAPKPNISSARRVQAHVAQREIHQLCQGRGDGHLPCKSL